MLEKEMRKVLFRYLKGAPLKIRRIESGDTELGIPDLHVRTEVKDIWIELKQLSSLPIKGNIKIPWRPGQRKWIMDHQELGGTSFLLLTIGTSWFMYSNIKEEYTREELYTLSLIPMNITSLSKYTFIARLNS